MAKKSLKAASDDGKSKNLMKSDDPKTFAKYLDAIPGNHVKSNQEIFYILSCYLIAYFNNHYTTYLIVNAVTFVFWCCVHIILSNLQVRLNAKL